MARDTNTTGFKATITVTLVPVNSYGDNLSEYGGEFTYVKTLPAKTFPEIAAILDAIK